MNSKSKSFQYLKDVVTAIKTLQRKDGVSANDIIDHLKMRLPHRDSKNIVLGIRSALRDGIADGFISIKPEKYQLKCSKRNQFASCKSAYSASSAASESSISSVRSTSTRSKSHLSPKKSIDDARVSRRRVSRRKVSRGRVSRGRVNKKRVKRRKVNRRTRTQKKRKHSVAKSHTATSLRRSPEAQNPDSQHNLLDPNNKPRTSSMSIRNSTRSNHDLSYSDPSRRSLDNNGSDEERN
ncbi:hypothetical protein FQA39_LY16223 [Lamprigera yunnana]|nr:hypothetical protein FQA39_LY16223 [Lamprigera yunnana]